MNKRLEVGKVVPGEFHVARYCYEGTIRTVHDGGIRRVVEPGAFEKRRDKTADVSFSVMEWFDGENDTKVIFKVCKYRGKLIVNVRGDYVKLNVGKIGEKRFAVDERYFEIKFKPDENPAHAILYTRGLMVSTELAVLANAEGELFPVPNPVPDAVLCG